MADIGGAQMSEDSTATNTQVPVSTEVNDDPKGATDTFGTNSATKIQSVRDQDQLLTTDASMTDTDNAEECIGQIEFLGEPSITVQTPSSPPIVDASLEDGEKLVAPIISSASMYCEKSSMQFSDVSTAADSEKSPLVENLQHSTEYVDNLLQSLNQQRLNAENCDFTVTVQGASFPVHKCILSAASPYFHQRIQEAESRLSTTFDLDQVLASCFGKLLDFIYLGKIFLDKNSVDDLLNTAQAFQVSELESLCKKFQNEKDQESKNQCSKVTKGTCQGHDVIICKTEPPDPDDLGKTLKALNDNLANDTDLMSSLFENQTSVISEILEKLKDSQVVKSGRGRRKGTPRRKSTARNAQEKNSAKSNTKAASAKKNTAASAKKETKKPLRNIKKEPMEHKDNLKTETNNDIGDATDDLDDFDNDVDFEEDLDDEDADETYEPDEGKVEGGSAPSRKRKAPTNRTNGTAKVPRASKRVRSRKDVNKEPGERRKRGRNKKARVTAFTVLKERLEALDGEQLADLGIRKLESSETMGLPDFPFTVNGAGVIASSTLDVSVLPLNSLETDTSLQDGEMPLKFVGNGVTLPPRLQPNSSQDDSPKENYCGYCKSSFKSKEALLIHKEQVHRNIRCEHCNKLFIRQEHLSRHINREHMKIFPDLVCKECNKEFKFTKKFMKHMEEEHQITKPFPCQFEGCGGKFKNINQLGHHHNTHQTERNLVCPTCGNLYRTKETLVCHMQRCRNVRDKLCDTCGAAFTNNQDLRQHIEIMHSGLRMYVCNVCGKDFSCASNLRRHKRIHDNAFPYKCSSCPASFRYSNTLKHHLQNKHNLQPPANSIEFREAKVGGRPPGDHPGLKNRRKFAAGSACRFPGKTQDHRLKAQRGKAQQVGLDQQGDVGQLLAGGQHRSLESEINAAVQSLESQQQQLGLDSSSTTTVGTGSGNFTLSPSIPPLAVMPSYRNQPPSAHVNLGSTNNITTSWPLAASAQNTTNMAAMLNAENATNTMIQHAHAMSALYHTPWGMGQH